MTDGSHSFARALIGATVVCIVCVCVASICFRIVAPGFIDDAPVLAGALAWGGGLTVGILVLRRRWRNLAERATRGFPVEQTQPPTTTRG